MPSMTGFELEQEVRRIARAMAIRNRTITQDLIAHLRERMSLEGVAMVMILCLERLMWLDREAVAWTVRQVIPADIVEEIRKMSSLAVCQQLIRKGFRPGKDFSADADGNLILSQIAKTAVVYS